MGKLFGTDGIRGIAGHELDCGLAFKVGRATAFVLSRQKGSRPIVYIGRDTRVSGDMLESAMAAGLCAGGADVLLLGIIPTPGVAYLTTNTYADAGVVISASHNSFEYNGIKIFNSKGYKLDDALEREIEGLVKKDEYPLPDYKSFGRIKRDENLLEEYIKHVISVIEGDLSGLRILIDCANGAASVTARKVFESLKCEADFIFSDPDGININADCGSTHLETLQRMVVEGKYDAGVGFDGDADRCLLVDEKGGLIDGDMITGACALDMKNRGKLRGNTLVGTVMSNLGLSRFAQSKDFKLATTQVGDRYVLEEMVSKGYAIGGEQSGHVIFLKYATTGDGQITAVKFLFLVKRMQEPASQVAGIVPNYPQTLINITVTNAFKQKLSAMTEISEEIARQEKALGEDGRVLVRCSGTEPLVRVMVEGKDKAAVEAAARSIAEAVRKGAEAHEKQKSK
jgi:phosphoglucosamine mutase